MTDCSELWMSDAFSGWPATEQRNSPMHLPGPQTGTMSATTSGPGSTHRRRFTAREKSLSIGSLAFLRARIKPPILSFTLGRRVSVFHSTNAGRNET